MGIFFFSLKFRLKSLKITKNPRLRAEKIFRKK